MTKNTPAPKTEEKKTEQAQNTTAQLSRELKAEIDKLPGDSFEDRLRWLMTRTATGDAPEDTPGDEGIVVLKMPKDAYVQLLAWQPSTIFRDMLVKSKV